VYHSLIFVSSFKYSELITKIEGVIMSQIRMNKQQGVIVRFDDHKGFGFIKVQDQGRDDELFFHISEYLPPRRPKVGDEVVFGSKRDNQGRLQACEIQELGFVQEKIAQKNGQIRRRNQQKSQQAEFEAGQKKRLFLGAAFYGVLVLLAATTKLSWLFVGWYLALGVITYLSYAKDKAAAQQGEWRTPESTLHVLSVLGGWVGAMVAQTYLRHKSQKVEFRLVYYFTVVVNLALLLAVLTLGEGKLSGLLSL